MSSYSSIRIYLYLYVYLYVRLDEAYALSSYGLKPIVQRLVLLHLVASFAHLVSIFECRNQDCIIHRDVVTSGSSTVHIMSVMS